MSSVLVQRRDGELLEVERGQRVIFGRGTPDVPVDLVLDHPAVSRIAGEIAAVTGYWHLANWSSSSRYVVENLEAPEEHLSVGPGRHGVPIPFEISMLVLPAGTDTVNLTVYAPEQPGLTVAPLPDGGARTELSFPLDRGAKYFHVLVALCEPRLRGDGDAPLPTTEQIARRLRVLPGYDKLTARAVDFHIDYVAKEKLRLTGGPTATAQTGFAARRTALARFALRFGLVGEEDLALLPRPSRTGAVAAVSDG